jgi:hypothetical protein
MGHNAMLTLLRASKHRPGGPLSDDDYDVVDNEGHVGRIVRTASSYTAGPDKPWFWSITCKVPNEPTDRDNAASLHDAMQAFKARWVAVNPGGRPRLP